MVTTVLGKVAVTPKGVWNGTTAYEKLDVVSYNGSSYLSVRDVPSGTSLSNTNYWMLLAQKGDTGNAIASIEKTATSGLTDTYTITFTNGNTTTFTVTNGEAATVIVGTVTTGAEGTAVVITNSGDDHDAVLNFTIPRGNTGNGIQGIELTATSGSVKTYTITFTDGETFSFDVTDGEVTETRLAEALEDYALTDGYYEDLVSGGSEQLLSSVYEEDSEPYLFRTSGGSIDIGDREEDTIVGGTVAWNQLAKVTKTTTTINGVTFTVSNGEAVSASGTASSNAYFYIAGNSTSKITVGIGKILMVGCPKNGGLNAFRFSLRTMNAGNATWKNDVGNGVIFNSAEETVDNVALFVGSGETVSNIVFKPQLINLTQMFGSTIADYIYSLEQANAGAGVAWFRKLFPKPYYAYNAGELLSVEGLTSHDTVGFNAWDEEWELGGISTSTGENISSSGNSRTKNYIPVIPSATYYFKSPVTLGLRFYDADKNIIKNYALSANSTYTMPSNCRFLRFVMVGVTQYANDICINLHWDGERDGEYEPYVKHSYPLDDSLTLRGIPKLDSNNKLYYDGDVYEADGTVTRKYGIVDLGSLTWSYQSGNARFQSSSLSGIIKESTRNHLSTKYQYGSTTTVDKTIQIGANSNVYIKDSAYTDAATFKTAMSGVYLVYELATPTTEEAEPYQTPQIVDDWGSEEYVITTQSDVAVPVGHDTRYMSNLKSKLEMAPDSPSDNGDYVVRHNNGENTYVSISSVDVITQILAKLPAPPTDNGSYTLTATVNNGTVTYSWES